MQGSGKTIFKNASVLLASQLVTWALTFALTIFLPRFLGPEALGALGIGLSIWTIIGVAASFGMDVLLRKEVARQPERARELLGASLVIRSVLMGLGFVVVYAYLQAVTYPPMVISVIYLVGITQYFWIISNAYAAVLQGLETMTPISLSNILGKVVNTVLGIGVLLIGLGVYAIAVVNALAAAVTLLIMARFLSRRYSLSLRFSFSDARAILGHSVPYLFSALALAFYTQVDVLVISWLIDPQTVGWYNGARQLFATSSFLPVAVMAALFPTLTRTYAVQPEALASIMDRSLNMLLVFSVPLGLGLLIISEPIVLLLYGEAFRQSGPVLGLMGIVLIFTYLNVLFGQYCIATDRQNLWAWVIVVAALANFGLDFLTVPWTAARFGNGALGGALSFTVTETVMTVVGFAVLPRGTLNRAFLRRAACILLAGGLMVAATWWLRWTFIAIPIGVGALVYSGLILLFRVIPANDMALLIDMLQKVLARVRRRTPEPSHV